MLIDTWYSIKSALFLNKVVITEGTDISREIAVMLLNLISTTIVDDKSEI